jgi:hypothetical protein
MQLYEDWICFLDTCSHIFLRSTFSYYFATEAGKILHFLNLLPSYPEVLITFYNYP